jgi:excinuclease ABC subunit A
VLEVDQTPIGKTPRSCPATYIGFWDTIRKLFADTLEAKARGYAAEPLLASTPARAAARAAKARACAPSSMSFLPDVKVLCETCHGARFNPETLAVTLARQEHWRRAADGGGRGRRFLRRHAGDIATRCNCCKDVGLGYLTLGQPSPTLQRRRGAAHQAGDRTSARCATT